MPKRRGARKKKHKTIHENDVSVARERETVLRANGEWTAFRLLGLPAELRNRVYREYIQDFTANTVGVTRLTYTVLPDLCDVSRQFRKEVRPLWFSETSFSVCAGANVWAQRNSTTSLNRHQNSRDSGVLVLSKRSRTILDNAGDDALMRKVRFVVFEGYDMLNLWMAERRLPPSKNPQSWPSHERRIGTLSMEAQVGAQSQYTLERFARYHEDETRLTDATVDAARLTAIAISRCVNFKGFSIRDLQSIAAALRVD
ncbi:hypothetical protein Slin15195_G070790 [Septoria linicola]|uniref:F-box domain-containing protein n=1 Tax=Septoria linicola TaxID=215465 RepID=A0A9Q9EK72_9PEZI|nr:hypothetical protein Slin15195_G070790 [Septoria linicola]